jgi:peptidoglycan/xylan/chitin deacetylase (PgdA/CDA1 family)
MKRRYIGFALMAFLAGCVADVHDHVEGDPSAEELQSWEDAFNERQDGKADSGGCSGVKVPDTQGFGMKVALTFDDGPNPATTPKVLDILAKHGISATFFINGRRVISEVEEAIVQRIVDEGHILANHSHEHKNLRNVSARVLDEQVRLTDNIMRKYIEDPRYFRLPFGSSNCETADHVRSYGYVVTGWHVDSADWCFASSRGGVGHCSADTFKHVPSSFRDDMVGFTLAQARSRGGGILLFHDVHQNTADKIETIITKLKESHFSFVNIDDIGVFPKLNGHVEPPKPFTGDACDSDDACNYVSGDEVGYCLAFGVTGVNEAFGFCTVDCEGFCDDKLGKAETFCTSLDGGLTGSCVSKAAPENGECATLPGTKPTTVERHIGSSSATPSTATACVPSN